MHTNKNISALILAGGKGSRMGSSIPKPLIQLNGKTFLSHILSALKESNIRDIAMVTGEHTQAIVEEAGKEYTYVFQPHPQGTGHAVMLAEKCLHWKEKDILIFVGDAPLIRADSIRQLIHSHQKTNAACSFLTAEFELHFPYARVLRDEKGNFLKCVEERDATEEEKKIREYMSSHFLFDGSMLKKFIGEIRVHPLTHEFYLTDMISILQHYGQQINPVKIFDFRELMGINTQEELSLAEKFIREI